MIFSTWAWESEEVDDSCWFFWPFALKQKFSRNVDNIQKDQVSGDFPRGKDTLDPKISSAG